MGTTENLEKTIQTISSDYIYQNALSSFLLLLMSCTETPEEESGLIQYGTDPALKEIQAKIYQYVIDLEEILTEGNDQKPTQLEEAMALKKEILSRYQHIYRYYAKWNVTAGALTDEMAVRQYQKQKVREKNIAFDLVLGDCVEFLESAKTPQEQKQIMGQLLKCAPLKMSKDRYYDLVEKSLYLAFAGQTEESIDLSLKAFEQTCAPERVMDYGSYFPEIAQWLERQKGIKPANLSDEDIEKTYTEFQMIFDELTKIETLFQNLYNDINAIIILLYLNFTFEDLAGGHFTYRDYYHSVREILKGEISELEIQALKERLYQLLESSVEPVIDKANELSKKEEQLIAGFDSFDTFSSDTVKILATETFVRSLFYGDLNEEIFHFDIDYDKEPATDGYKEKRFAAFLTSMKEYFLTLPLPMKKYAMQILFTSLPPAMSMRELIEYLKMSFETASSFEHKVLIVDKIGELFNDYNFSTHEPQDIDYHHHDHCDCGHEHHHHNHCDCGHEHHHHEHCDCEHDHHHDHCDCGHEHHHHDHE